MRRALILAVAAMLVMGAFLIAFSHGVAAEGQETGVFPDRTFEITRSPPGGPKSDTYTTPISPTMSGRWSARLESLAGAAMIVQVYRIDGSILALEGSSKLRAIGESTVPILLFAGMNYQAQFTPYGKAGLSVLTEHFVANVPPTSCFTYSPSNPIAGQTVSFDGSCSTDSDGQIVSYDWDFGDGATGSGVTASHSYAAEGTYSASLRVTDDLQAYATHTETITVGPPPVNQPPTASFIFSPSAPLVGQLVSFDATASRDPDGTIVDFHWAWGDGSSGSSGSNPMATHTYAAPGTYTVLLTVTDNGGLTADASASFRVLSPPTASFTFSPASPLVGENVAFDASASADLDGTILAYDWDFGDGTTGTGVNPVHAYSAAGPYNVLLTVTDDDGLTGTATKIVNVGGQPIPPTASFTYSPAKPLEGQAVAFDASGSSDPDDAIVSYAWTFGDGASGSGVNPSHTYASFGTYTVTLTVTDASSLSDTTSQALHVYAAPVAAFSFTPLGPNTGEVVTFDASASSDADGTISSYAWDFGDGSSGSGVTATHTYSTAGTFSVMLTVVDSDGFSDSLTKPIAVGLPPQPPTAAFTFSPAKPLVGAPVTFDGSISTDPDNAIVSYAWTFGDGSSGSGANPSHTYAAAGTYAVTLTVTDATSLTGSVTHSVQVYAGPTAAFTFSPAAPLVGQTVAFDASGSSDPDGTITSYAWTFGDGATGSGVTANHAYAAFGTYTVGLTVTDSNGFTSSASHAVTVLASPTASFTYSPAKPLLGTTVSFDASASADPDGTIASYAWTFGDSATGSGVAPTHVYAAFGTYTVGLTVTDNAGLTGSTTRSVKIYAAPTASFTYSPAKPLAGAAVSFDASGSTDPDGTIASYAWTFGDSSTGTGAAPTHTYAAYGTYTVSLTVTDSDGFTASTSLSVKIYAPPTASFTYSPAKPLFGTSVSFDASGSSDPDGTIASYAWTFGDSSTGTGATPSHVYTAFGTYTVSLTVTDSDGFTASTSKSVKIYAAPSASFTYSPAKPLLGASVSFNAAGSSDPDGTIASYAWTFGDASTGTGVAPSHVYATYGTYNVGLTVTDSDGFTASTSLSVKIYAAPSAAFTFTPAQPLMGTPVSFDASGSSDPDGTIASYAWTFGDSSTGTGAAPTHTYAAYGTYTVSLTVTDSDGFTASTSKSVKVYSAPTASFTFSPSNPTTADSVSFDASASFDLDGTIASYAWDFGDGSSATGVTASHTFSTANTFHVVLTVTDSDGLTGTVTKDVVVTGGAKLPGTDWTFYDFFNVPYGEWWDIRQFYGLSGDTPLGADCFSLDGINDFWCTPGSALPDVAAYPYSNWVKTPVGDNMIFAPYRFTADIRQNPALTVEKPVMLPLCADLKVAAAAAGVTIVCPTTPPTGGSISLDERIGYLDNARATALGAAGCPDLTFLNDGFIGEIQATITMDNTAALKLFGVTDPSTQWANGTSDTSLLKSGCGTGLLLDPSSGVLEKGLKAWFEAQGNGPYDIYSAFGTGFQVFSMEAYASYNAATGKSTLFLDMTAWGLETLFARWAYWGATTYATGLTGAAPTGWWGMEVPWTEGLRFIGDFGATDFSASVSGVIQNHFRASGEPGPDTFWYTADDVAKWVWQPVLGDRYPGTPLHPTSELGAATAGTFYVGATYIHSTPGSKRYGAAYSYDYVPAVWQLKAGETQTFKFQTRAAVLYDPFLSPRTDNPRALVSTSALLVLGSTVPATGVGTYNAATNTLTVTGPISVGAYPTVPSGKPAESRPIYNLVKGP